MYYLLVQECAEAIELADEALKVRPVSYEAFYARAKARADSNHLEGALSDIQEALQIAPPQNRQDRRVLVGLREEIISRMEGAGTSKGSGEFTSRTRLRASVDTLTEL